MKTLTTAIIATLAFAGAANALDVQNQDSVAHKIYLNGDRVDRTVTLQPGEWLRDACYANACSFMLDNDAQKWGTGIDETVIIRDGKLEMQPSG